MPIPAFLSYSHKNRKSAGLIKAALDQYGFNAFLAHEDLSPSVDWQKTILQRLRACMVFFPLLTRAFKESSWTDQESGIAVALKKIIVPLKLNVDPYGFIGQYQAQSLERAYSRGKIDITILQGCCWNVVKTLTAHRRIGNEVKDGIISVFASSASFDLAAANARHLGAIEPFTTEQLETIVRAGISNDQIHHGWKARDYINSLVSREKARIGSKLIAAFKQASQS